MIRAGGCFGCSSACSAGTSASLDPVLFAVEDLSVVSNTGAVSGLIWHNIQSTTAAATFIIGAVLGAIGWRESQSATRLSLPGMNCHLICQHASATDQLCNRIRLLTYESKYWRAAWSVKTVMDDGRNARKRLRVASTASVSSSRAQ